jgi:hypothetical protein
LREAKTSQKTTKKSSISTIALCFPSETQAPLHAENVPFTVDYAGNPTAAAARIYDRKKRLLVAFP